MRTISLIALVTAMSCAAASATEHVRPPGIPSLDELAGDWLPMAQVANPPAVHNFNQMLVVNRDLTSVFCNPGGLYPWKKGYPQVQMLVDGKEYKATETRCYAYRALRRNAACGGVAIETDTRMVNEENSVLCKIAMRNNSDQPRTLKVALKIAGTAQDGGLSNSTQRVNFVSAAFPLRKPDEVKEEGGSIIWEWNLSLVANGSAEIGYTMGDGPKAEADKTAKRIAARAADFEKTFAGCKQAWEDRWADAFTPGNKHFSGHLPVLKTDDAAMARNYYVGAWTMLALERTQFPVHPRSFITSGERADGVQYFWDASMQATAWAMLEPAGMKATLLRWLTQNPRGDCVIDIRKPRGFDNRKHGGITGYAFNASNIFHTADDYIRLTGDRAFLDEKLENGRTVLDQMEALATDWQTLPPGPDGTGLVNYGENGNLLECAPEYIHCVPSLHAQDVAMMRKAADLLDLHAAPGDHERAESLRASAAKLLPSVLNLYKPADGVWYAYHKDGKKVELRHCVDYIYIGNAIGSDLSDTQKSEMNAFVKNELLMRDWMRAMSRKDAAAARSDRPDHGPMGAYDGWVPLTVGTMWRLGATADAVAFYDRTASVTHEGPFAQAREFYGPRRTEYDAPVRVAERQGCMKECISGVAFTDVVINTFFGFSPRIGTPSPITDAATPRPFSGQLLNVMYQGGRYDLTADSKGVHLEKAAL